MTTFTEEEAALFRQMWNDGVSRSEIGQRWGFTGWWATKWASRMGLKPRIPTLTNRQVKEIQRRAATGEINKEIAKALGLSHGTVSKYAQGHKPAFRTRKGAAPKFDPGLADRMSRSGMSNPEIAAHFGVRRESVWKALKKYRKRLEALSARKPKTLIPPLRPAA